jgi:hypothetical protein
VAYNGPRREVHMNPRPPDTLEVHVSFETNRLASAYLADAYELLLPTVPDRKPVAAESIVSSSRPKQAQEKTAV